MACQRSLAVLRLWMNAEVQSHGLRELRCCPAVVLLWDLDAPLALLCLKLLLMLMVGILQRYLQSLNLLCLHFAQ